MAAEDAQQGRTGTNRAGGFHRGSVQPYAAKPGRAKKAERPG
jgi:hypothetical protein